MPIFKSSTDSYFDRPLYLDIYHPYKIRNSEGVKVKNPLFDRISGLVLDVKDNLDKGVNYYFNKANKIFADGIIIAVVPSHDPASIESGIRRIAQMLIAENRVDATGCLVRSRFVQKLAHGGRRSKEIHLQTIRVAHPQVIRRKEVLLLDDVMTSGNSLDACMELLLAAGAANVQRFAMALTYRA